MSASKACPVHGPIDWPLTALECPACGEPLEAYDSPLELALAMPAAPAPTGGDVRANERAMIQERALADLAAAQRRLRRMRQGRGR